MPSTPRRPGPERRAQIADATLALIGSRGLSGLSTAALAEKVGVTTGALFRHFPSRDAILEAAVERAVARIEATLPDPDLPPTERLQRMARARVGLLRSEPGVAWLLRSQEAALALPQAAVDRLGAVVKGSQAYIRRALRDGIAAGEVRGDVPVDVLVFNFTSTVHALVRAPGTRGRGVRRIAAARALDGLFRLMAPARKGS